QSRQPGQSMPGPRRGGRWAGLAGTVRAGGRWRVSVGVRATSRCIIAITEERAAPAMVANEPCLGLCRGMSIRFVIAVTDGDWFEFLRQRPGFAELNFWAPSGSPFRALTPGELF